MNYVYAVLTLLGAVILLCLMVVGWEVFDDVDELWKKVLAALPTAVFMLGVGALLVGALSQVYGALL